jgi:hypothetical protein
LSGHAGYRCATLKCLTERPVSARSLAEQIREKYGYEDVEIVELLQALGASGGLRIVEKTSNATS